MSSVKWMGGGERHFKTVKTRENISRYVNLPLSPPALVSVQITEASSVRRSTLSVEPRPRTFVCTGQRLQTRNKNIYIDAQITMGDEQQLKEIKGFTHLFGSPPGQFH